jgi:ligand-binding SRPBCC domain-containing protein
MTRYAVFCGKSDMPNPAGFFHPTKTSVSLGLAALAAKPKMSAVNQIMPLRFHTLRREQWVSRPLDEVFAFFADAHNLETITPPWLGFRILSLSSGSMAQGTEIRYRLRLHGVPLHWLTEIRRWNPPHCFVDVQRSGPYRLWHHTHRFEAHNGRTRMTDVVRYILPFGPLGQLVNILKVRRDVSRIFDYRRQKIEDMFGYAEP